MAGNYDDRDGKIWMDGKLIDWREANVHILTHAMHYASSVFEGERAYGGKIFESRKHSERLHASAKLIDFDIPWTVDEIEAAKYETLRANGFEDAYVRAVAWRGSGPDMGVSAARNPVRLAVATWEWGAYYGDSKFKGAKLDISKWKRPSPETIPSAAKAAGLYMICTMSKHAAEAKGCSDAMMMDYRGYVAEATGANIFFVRDGDVHTPDPDCFLNGLTRQTVIAIEQGRYSPSLESAFRISRVFGVGPQELDRPIANHTPRRRRPFAPTPEICTLIATVRCVPGKENPAVMGMIVEGMVTMRLLMKALAMLSSVSTASSTRASRISPIAPSSSASPKIASSSRSVPVPMSRWVSIPTGGLTRSTVCAKRVSRSPSPPTIRRSSTPRWTTSMTGSVSRSPETRDSKSATLSSRR